jgi:hypothetical protein
MNASNKRNSALLLLACLAQTKLQTNSIPTILVIIQVGLLQLPHECC